MDIKKIPEPGLEFYKNPNYPVDDPRYGLERFQPYDKDTRPFSVINAVAIGPSRFEKPLRSFWYKLVKGIAKTEPRDVPYKLGIEQLFQINSITSSENLEFYKIEDYAGELNKQYESALQKCIAKTSKESIILFIPPEDERTFDFRDDLKLTLIKEKIKSQFVRPQTLQRTDSLGGVLNNFAVGLYAKYGGVPWRIRDPRFSNIMVLGISFHLVRSSRFDAPERTIFGFSEIVDEFGHHVAMAVNPVTLKAQDFENFYNHKSLFMPKELIQNLVCSSIQKYKNKTSDIVPRKIVIHKTSLYHKDEVEGIIQGMKDASFKGEYAFVHLQNETGYKTYRIDDYKSMRGIFLKPNPKAPFGVLWTSGVIPSKFWNKEDKKWQYWEKGGVRIGTASPIGISVHRESNIGEINLDFLAEQTLALTKMRYNNLEPSVREPVSTYFARCGGKFVSNIWNRHNKEIDLVMENLDSRFFL